MGKKKSSVSWYNSEGFRETTEDFHHRLDWQRQHRTLDDGKPYAQHLEEQREAWLARPKAGRNMPLVGRPSQPSLAGPKDTPLKLEPIDNPAPDLSACYASMAFRVSGPGTAQQTYLRIPISESDSGGLFLPSLKVFRWEAEATVWLPILDSGYDATQEVAWAAISTEGIYVAIALPQDRDDMSAQFRLFRQRHALQAMASDGTKTAGKRTRAKAAELLGAKSNTKKANPSGRKPRPESLDLHLRGGKSLQLPEWTLMELQLEGWQGTQTQQLTVPYDLESLAAADTASTSTCSTRGWASHGPLNVNGRIKSILTHPTNSNILFAGAANGGLWRTEDAGLTWRSVWPSNHSMAFGSIALCRNAPNNMIAATGENTPGYGGSFDGKGLYVSYDGGTTWARFKANFVGLRISKVEMHPSNPELIYVASDAGLYVRNPMTLRFDLKISGTFSDLVMDPNNPNILYAAKYRDGIYKSTDGGSTWNASNGVWLYPPPPREGGEGDWQVELEAIWAGIPTGTAAEWIKLAIGKNGPFGSNYLVCKLGTNGSLLYFSNTAGYVWEPMGSVGGVPYATWTSTVAIHPNDPNILLAGDLNLYRRTAPNQPFVQTVGTHADHHTIAFDPNNSNILWVATDGGVYRSTDYGQNWTLRSYLLVATQLYDFGVSQQDTLFLAASTQDQNQIRTTGSFEWQPMPGSEGGLVYVDPNDGNTVYLCPWFNNLMKSRDRGETFQYINAGLTVFHDGRQFQASRASAISARPGVPNELLTTVIWFKDANGVQLALNRVFRSTDQGNTWQEVLNTDGEPLHVQHNPWAGQVCYVSTSRGKLYRSVDGGLNWTQPNAWQTGRPQVSISAMEIASGFLVGIACGAPDYKLYISIDSGTMFTNRSGQNPGTMLPQAVITSIVFHPTAFGVYYVATDLGVFRTLNGGEDWEPYNQGISDGELPQVQITRMRLRAYDMRLFASTFGRGMYYRQL